LNLGQELREQEDFCHLLEEYLLSYSELMEFEGLEPSQHNLDKWTQFLKMFKERHKVIQTIDYGCTN
jgi:hypothetical protein